MRDQIYLWLIEDKNREYLSNSTIRAQFKCHPRFVRQARARLQRSAETKQIAQYCAQIGITVDAFMREWSDGNHRVTLRRAMWGL